MICGENTTTGEESVNVALKRPLHDGDVTNPSRQWRWTWMGETSAIELISCNIDAHPQMPEMASTSKLNVCVGGAMAGED